MPRTKWRTVSCADDSIRSHASETAAYLWVGNRLPGLRFRVQFDRQHGGGWQTECTVESIGGGFKEVDR